MTLFVVFLFSVAFGLKQAANILSGVAKFKPMADVVCVVDDEPVSDPDDATCPATYVSLYNKLPSTTTLDTDLAAFNEKCLLTICSKPACVTLVNGVNKVYNDAFKTSLKANCLPTAAADLNLDQCRKTDDKVISSLEDADDCLDSYDALIELLPETTTPAKKFNRTLLSTGADAFGAFKTKCAKFVCNKEDCYQAIIRKTISTYDNVLKTTLQETCNPHPATAPPGGNTGNGYLSGTVNVFLLLTVSFLASLIV
jgi:hypothetical protein